MALDELTITLSDPDGRVSVETLTEALENALDMLRSVASDIVQTGVRVDAIHVATACAKESKSQN